MVHLTPGSLIHYRAAGSTLPLWPAVVCTEDVAPEDFLSTRPHGYVTLVLLMGEKLEFRWALTTEMMEFDPFLPFTDEETIENTPGLGEAYAIGNSALEAGLGLDHWREQFRNSVTVISSDSEEVDADADVDVDARSEDDTDDADDPDLREAIRQSREIFYGKTHAKRSPTLPTPSLSPPKRMRRPSTGLGAITLVGSDNGRQQPGLARTPLCPFPGPKNFSRESCLDHTSRHSNARQATQEAGRPSRVSLGSASNNLLNLNRLDRRSTVPTTDTIEGHLSASKEFVLVRVGAEGEERMFPLNTVWNRPYFREPRTGVMHFTHNDDGMWELLHPGFAEIELEDFNFIAQYLESGDFGLQRPEGEDEVQEAFAQITSTWPAAEKIGMADLLDHIINKLERLPWDLWNIMAMACHVYGTTGVSLPAQERMKDILATEIAQNYWIYVEDDHLRECFIQRLKDLPELERDIYARRIAALEARLNSEQDDEDSDMDMD